MEAAHGALGLPTWCYFPQELPERALSDLNGPLFRPIRTDRMEEVCGAAQQAIDASGDLGYRVEQNAQRLLEQALALQATDPKRAVALCRDAYRTAAYKRRLE
jgi:hypothetical protein